MPRTSAPLRAAQSRTAVTASAESRSACRTRPMVCISVKVPCWHSRSQVEYQIAARLGAADQRAAIGGLFHPVGGVADGPGEPVSPARLAHARAARTAAPHAARIRQAAQGRLG